MTSGSTEVLARRLPRGTAKSHQNAHSGWPVFN